MRLTLPTELHRCSLSYSEPLVPHRSTQADRTRRAGKAVAIAADAEALRIRRFMIILQASGFMLATLLALLLTGP
jgi:hypothetical protein